MADGKLHRLDTFQEDALVARLFHLDPAVFVFSGSVISKRRGWKSFARIGDDQACTDQNLKSVANPKHQLASVAECEEGVAKGPTNLVCEHGSGAQVITITESTGEADDLI